jgi:predicted RNase H-like HicB family nuclease
MRTSAKSSSTSARTKRNRLDRPFAPNVLADARRTVDGYQVVLWSEGSEWYGRGLELPGVMGDGPTPDRCVANVREALMAAVAHLIETGEPVPPATGERRTEQVNVRLTPAEKLDLEIAARREGYQGVSDYVRARALASPRNAARSSPKVHRPARVRRTSR